MFPLINVWGVFSDNGSFSLTFSHVLPVSLFKSNSSSASVGTVNSWTLGLLQSQEESRGGCGMDQSNGTVLVEFLWWGWKYPPAVEFHPVLPYLSPVLYFSPSSPAGHCVFLQSFYDGNVCDLPLLAHLQLCTSHLAAHFAFQHNSQGSSDCRQSYPGVQKGHSCLSAVCGLMPAAFTGSLIGQVMLSLLLLGLAAASQIGRKAGRTRDLRYKLLLYSQPVKTLISSGSNKEIPWS